MPRVKPSGGEDFCEGQNLANQYLNDPVGGRCCEAAKQNNKKEMRVIVLQLNIHRNYFF